MGEDVESEADMDIYHMYPCPGWAVTFFKLPDLQQMIDQLAYIFQVSPEQVTLLVKCPWLPGREMYLPEALAEYYPNMEPTAVVISRAYGMYRPGVGMPIFFDRFNMYSSTEARDWATEEEGDEGEESVEEEWEDEELAGELEDEERLGL
jgi:hypothetical protein